MTTFHHNQAHPYNVAEKSREFSATIGKNRTFTSKSAHVAKELPIFSATMKWPWGRNALLGNLATDNLIPSILVDIENVPADSVGL